MPMTSTQGYVLGHDDAELERLMLQSRFFGVLTEQLLRDAGLAPGMTVLDVGCGAGDVSLLAARMVGPRGRVIGVDASAAAIALARRRAQAMGFEHVELRTGDLATFDLDGPVDALIGRLVLIHLPDPSAVLKRLAARVAPGGIIAFHEIHIAGAMAVPPCPLFETLVRRLHETLQRVGVDPSTGLRLAQIFLGAGLPKPEMLLGARVEHHTGTEVYANFVEITRTLLPAMEKTGVATRAEVDLPTLRDRLCAEAAANSATLVGPALIGAWTRRPT
jgi:SAM-dependent methyltransferase